MDVLRDLHHAPELIPVAAALAGAIIAGLPQLRRPLPWLAAVETLLFAGAAAACALILGLRAVEVGHAPMRTLHESLLLLAAFTGFSFATLTWRQRIRGAGPVAGALMLAIVLFAAARRDIVVHDLPAALRSPWFVPHVSTYMLGYGLLAIAALTAVPVLLSRGGRLPANRGREVVYVPSQTLLHGLLMAGFVLVTLGLATGILWAWEAWGTYWSWDPKESWALVTWLMIAAYLHLRLRPTWGARHTAGFVLIMLAVAAFTFLGMHLLPGSQDSLHLYTQ